MAGAVPRTTFMSLWKQGWSTYPEIMGSALVSLIGIGMGVTGVVRYLKNDGDNRRYKMTYVVMRSNDPRAKYVHKD